MSTLNQSQARRTGRSGEPVRTTDPEVGSGVKAMFQSQVNDRFTVVVRQVAAPGRGRNYYMPAEVRVMDTTVSEWHAVRGLNGGVKYRRRVCGTRHSGPRSEYGRALAEAGKLAAELNRANASAAFDSAAL